MGQIAKTDEARRRRRQWLQSVMNAPHPSLPRRVFSLDALVCPRCLGPMTVIAYITEAAVVSKILRP